MSVTVEDLMEISFIEARNTGSLKGVVCTGISTDSRSVQRGEIFFALRGESFDGHEFIDDAFSAGALLVVVDKRACIEQFQEKPIIVVDDTTKALGKLANVYRKKFTIPLIAVAGSNGKTTTKEMIAAVLSTQGRVLSTKGNLNNHVGVPQTLFRLERSHDVAVIEIGTNHFGELHYLCEILEPTQGIITNIGHEHMEFFKNLNGVARAEGELFDALGSSGVGFVNNDDANIVAQARKVTNKVTYGISSTEVDVRGLPLSVDEKGCAAFSVTSINKEPFDVHLQVPGKHMVLNGIAAAAVGSSHGISPENIQHALENFTAVGKRMEVITVGDVTILNDSYNANPDSVLAALETLASIKCEGKRIVVLADMLELGESSISEHQRIGKAVRRLELEYVLTSGVLAAHITEKATAKVNVHFEEKQKLSEYLVRLIAPGDIVLVKGSRGMKMEDVVTYLQERLGSKAA